MSTLYPVQNYFKIFVFMVNFFMVNVFMVNLCLDGKFHYCFHIHQSSEIKYEKLRGFKILQRKQYTSLYQNERSWSSLPNGAFKNLILL